MSVEESLPFQDEKERLLVFENFVPQDTDIEFTWDSSYIGDLSDFRFERLDKINGIRYYQLCNEIVTITKYSTFILILDELKSCFGLQKNGLQVFKHSHEKYIAKRMQFSKTMDKNKLYQDSSILLYDEPFIKDEIRKNTIFRYILGLDTSSDDIVVRFDGVNRYVVSCTTEVSALIPAFDMKPPKIKRDLIKNFFNNKSIMTYHHILFQKNEIQEIENRLINVIQSIDKSHISMVNTIISKMVDLSS